MTVVYGLGAACGWACADYFAARASRGIGAMASLFWIMAFGLPLLGLLAAVVDRGLPSGVSVRGDVAIAVLVGVGDVVAFGMFLFALRVGDLAIVGSLAATSGGIAAVAGIVLGASLSTLAFVALPLAVVGAALAATGPRVAGVRSAVKGLAPALTTAVAGACVFVLLGQISHLHAFSTVFLARIVAIAIVGPLAARRGVIRVDAEHARLLAIAGVLDGLGYASYAAAASRGPVPIAAVTATQAASLSAVLAIVLLHERPARHQLVGIATTVVAVSLLALGG